MGKKKPKPPVPPKEAPEPDGGKQWSTRLTELLKAVADRFPNTTILHGRMPDEPAILATPDDVHKVAVFLKEYELLKMNYCRCVTGIDKVDRFEVVYNLAHLDLGDVATDAHFDRVSLVSVITDRENPVIPSLIDVWRTVDYQEREAFDLVGMRFEGHPDHRRILLDEDFIGHPLRKDYPLEGKWEDMKAIGAYLDEEQIKMMKEAAGEDFDPIKDVPPSFKR